MPTRWRSPAGELGRVVGIETVFESDLAQQFSCSVAMLGVEIAVDVGDEFELFGGGECGEQVRCLVDDPDVISSNRCRIFVGAAGGRFFRRS